MTLQLSQTISDGIRRVLTRTGGVLFVTLIAIQFLVQTSVNTVVLGLFPPQASGELGGTLGLTLPVSPSVATTLLIGGFILNAVYFIGLSRALTRPHDQLSTLPSQLFTRRIGRALVSMIAGGIVVGVSVTLGTLLLILPGIFLSICFLFFIFAVSVEDRRAIGALKRSWALSRGHRIKLAVLVVFAGSIGAIIGVMGTLFDVANVPIVGEVVTNTLGSILFVLLYGLIAAAYLQVQDDGSDERGGSVTITSQESASSTLQ